MGWTRYLMHDFFTAREFDRLDDAAERRRQTASSARGDLRCRVDDLEDDLARMALLVHSLAEACVRNGALTREEISAVMTEVDLADGVADGKLDPATQRPPAEPSKRSGRPEDFLKDLESQDG
ncbi:MAG: hypothetical protein HQ567_12200 [Candidatus Nealsonbacteria bacterium]|nr:hypothetical protein [Candidatus Nealsonbacteria bacterium]